MKMSERKNNKNKTSCSNIQKMGNEEQDGDDNDHNGVLYTWMTYVVLYAGLKKDR